VFWQCFAKIPIAALSSGLSLFARFSFFMAFFSSLYLEIIPIYTLLDTPSNFIVCSFTDLLYYNV
jgi:hypothetical protein